MNDNPSNLPPFLTPEGSSHKAAPKPDPTPIGGLLSAVEALVRRPHELSCHFGREGVVRILSLLLAIAVGGGLFYGLIIGSFSGHEQLWAAPLKVAGGMLLTGLICLPSLYVFSCLGGAKASLAEIAGLLSGLLALTTILLLSFAPVAWVFSQSTESLAAMGILHLLLSAVAVAFGLRLLQRGFQHFNAQNSAGLFCWTIMFLLVAMQMTTALRPLIGRADTFLPKEKRFFLQHWADCLDGKPAKVENRAN